MGLNKAKRNRGVSRSVATSIEVLMLVHYIITYNCKPNFLILSISLKESEPTSVVT